MTEKKIYTGMPLDEVNKPGGILQRIEYFNSESPAELGDLLAEI
ncbi:MAG: hypothetical protein Q7J86_00725 [Bacteroidota bacterium]|nr:hypothetical protein [Bacteroidota bacterium]